MNERELLRLEPDPVWPDRYETERARIEGTAGNDLLGVFHVGSTAIPNVPGKPALDVIAVYDDEDALSVAVDALTSIDRYELAPEANSVLVHWADEYSVFVKLHVRDDAKVRNQLLFREYLRDTPEACREYARVKREAIASNPDDLRGYTEAKSAVVSRLLEEAHEREYDDRLPAFC